APAVRGERQVVGVPAGGVRTAARARDDLVEARTGLRDGSRRARLGLAVGAGRQLTANARVVALLKRLGPRQDVFRGGLADRPRARLIGVCGRRERQQQYDPDRLHRRAPQNVPHVAWVRELATLRASLDYGQHPPVMGSFRALRLAPGLVQRRRAVRVYQTAARALALCA